MNKSYLIVPVILLAIFGFTYNGALKDMRAKEVMNQEIAAKKKAEDQKHKDEVEKKATEDAKKHQAEREAADLAKQQAKDAAYTDAMNKLREEADDYAAQAAKLSKEAADLDKQISDGRNQKEQLAAQALDLDKAVELARIRRGNAELEIQRMIEMVATKLKDSSIAASPPPPLQDPAK